MNLFSTAKKVEAPAPKAKKNDKERVLIKGLEDYAIICDLEKNLAAIKETLRLDVVAGMKSYFGKFKTRPENFRGFEGDAEASCELKIRPSASPLNPAEVELAKDKGIPTEEVELIPERFVINPALMADQKKLEAISKALSKVPGCEDFILHQERQVNTVVNEASLTKVFEAGLFESHGSLVSVLSVKPTVKTPEVSSAIARAQKLLGVEVKR